MANTKQPEYTEAQIRRLKELVSVAHKTWKLGEACATQAHHAIRNYTKGVEKLKGSYSTIEKIGVLLSKQLKELHQMLQNKTLVPLNVENSNEILSALNTTFEKLKSKLLHPKLIAQQQPEQNYKNLYDFVDADSVNELRANALEEVAVLGEIRSQSQAILAHLKRKFQSIVQMVKTNKLKVNPWPAAEKTTLLTNEFNIINTVLVDITSHHDFVFHLYKTHQYTDLSLVEHRSAELQAVVAKTETTLQDILQVTQELEMRTHEYNSVYTNLLTVTAAVDGFYPEMQQQFVRLDALEGNVKEREQKVKSLLEELVNLRTWYDLFYIAYDELIIEVCRRHAEYQRQQKIVDDYSKNLEAMWREESQRRDMFFEHHGRYLPMSLCPQIMEETIRVQCYPTHFITTLPVFSENNGDSNNNHSFKRTEDTSKEPRSTQ